jgi:suppressor of G2 allele of SKP1
MRVLRKMRHEWHESADNIYIEVFSTGLCGDDGSIIVSVANDRTVRIDVTKPATWFLNLNLLCRVDGEKMTWRVTPYKLVVTLPKVVQGWWGKLEASATDDTRRVDAYPSSCQKPHDWTAIEKSAVKEEQPPSDPMSFMRSLYANGDDETRRAMQKSMEESGGTVLNMNWDQVSKGKVEKK